MIDLITQIVIGFSVVSAPILFIAYAFFLREMTRSVLGIAACFVLLTSLTGLQLEHLSFLESGGNLFASRRYTALLLTVPPTFYVFSREVLLPGSNRSPLNLLHIVPLLVSFFVQPERIPPVAFLLGAGYSIWFAMFVFGMRRNVSRYRFELFFFGFFAIMAVVLLVLAVTASQIGNEVFFRTYAIAIGLSFILIVATMIVFPNMLQDMSDAAKLAYASSTLNEVDIDEKLRILSERMEKDRLYRNEALNLAMLADSVDLTPHQLSELINTRFEMGFSRYVRELRVAEACRLLLEDPQASVLSIGLTTGFRSQSNFYAAFREIKGTSPGSFRNANHNGR